MRRFAATISAAALLGAATVVVTATPAIAAPIGYSVGSDLDDQLYSIDLATGVATAIGATGFDDVECLTFSNDGSTLFAVDDASEQLITLDTATGAGTAVGALGVEFLDCGLTFDADGRLFMSTDDPQIFYEIDPETGAATEIGDQGQEVTGLAADCDVIYGLGGDETDNLVTIDPETGLATEVGPLVNVTVNDGGIDFDAALDGQLWGLNDAGPEGASQTFTIDTTTGEATVVAEITVGGEDAEGFEGLAITGITCVLPPPPPAPPQPQPEPAPAPPVTVQPRFTG